MPIPSIALLAGMLCAVLTQPVFASADGKEDVYRVRFSADFSTVEVEACFAGAAPDRLQRSREAGEYVMAVRAGNEVLRSEPRNDELQLGDLPPDSCVSWALDLARAADNEDYRHVMRAGDALLTRADLWFWQAPERQPPRVSVMVHPGWSVSAPWEELSRDETEWVFRPEATPASWTSRIAIGPFPAREVELPGGSLRLAIIGDADDEQAAMLEDWITVSARAVAGVTGEFLHPRPQVLVVALDPRWRSGRPSSGPVPWAHVIRGGGVAAEFFVDPQQPAEKFAADWTATHELSHMLLPYVAGNDRWLSEGVASYYQNVLRARDRRLTEVEAWQKLHAGFQRGQVGTGDPTPRPSRNPGVMRTYWGGAAMMLTADAELRALSHGRHSLDTALAALRDCCRDPGRRWTARELFQQLDHLTGFTVFADLYQAFRQTGEFPDVSSTYAKLGIVPGEERIAIDADAPWGKIRHFIMNSSPPTGERRASGGSR